MLRGQFDFRRNLSNIFRSLFKMAAIIAILLVASGVLNGICGQPFWVRFEKNFNWTKELPGHCYEITHKVGQMEEGETKRIEGLCMTAKCLSNKDVQYFGCPLVFVKPPCYVVNGDVSKPHPECCYDIKCKEANLTLDA